MRLHKCWTTTYLLRAGIQQKRPTKDYSIESNSLKRRIQIFISWVFNSFNSRNNILSVVTKEMFISMSKKESKLPILKEAVSCFTLFGFLSKLMYLLLSGKAGLWRPILLNLLRTGLAWCYCCHCLWLG